MFSISESNKHVQNTALDMKNFMSRKNEDRYPEGMIASIYFLETLPDDVKVTFHGDGDDITLQMDVQDARTYWFLDSTNGPDFVAAYCWNDDFEDIGDIGPLDVHTSRGFTGQEDVDRIFDEVLTALDRESITVDLKL